MSRFSFKESGLFNFMAADLSLLFTLKAKNEAGAEMKALESQIASLKARIKEVKTETDVPFKTERLKALQSELNKATAAHKELKTATQASAASQKELSDTVTSLLPNLGATSGALARVATSLGPVGIAAIGAAVQLAAVGIAVGAVALAGQKAIDTFFGLAKSAADFRGKLFDLSQQTGVSVETLSALEIVAKTTGGSIDNITQSLVTFQTQLDEAQDSTTKAGKLFRELGVDVNDTESAFRQSLAALAKMPEGFRQTNDAAELFGKRGGKQLLAILKETKGDLDGTIIKLKEFGLIVSKEDAVAADRFNDQLAIMEFQFRALLGKEVIPAATRALEDLSKTLKENRATIDLAGKGIGIAANLIGLAVKGMILNFVRAPIAAFNETLIAAGPALTAIAVVYERIALATGLIARANFGAATAGVTAPTPLEVGGSATTKLPGLKSGLLSAALAASEDQARKELEIQRHRTEELKLEHERRGGFLEDFYQQQQTQADARLSTLLKQIASERAAIQAGYQRGEIDQAEANQRSVDLDLRAEQAKNKAKEENDRLQLEKERALVQEEVRLRQGAAAIEEARRNGELARLERDLDRQATVESEVITKQLEFLTAAHKERLGIIKFELEAESTSLDRKKELNTEKTVSEREYTDAFKRLTQERIDAANREAAATAPGVGRGVPEGGGVQPGFDAGLGLPPALSSEMLVAIAAQESAFQGLGVAMSETLGLSVQAGQIIGETLAGAFGQLAHAVGDAVHSFVLFGKVEGGFRKFAAEIIASLAASAAVQAVYQLAQGLAWTALNFFFPNPKYAQAAGLAFASAAVFGSIAGVAAVAGRGIVGNAFNQTGGGAGGGGSSGGGSSSFGNDRRDPVDLARNQIQERVIIFHPEIHISGEAGEAFTYKVENVIWKSYNRNGSVKDLMDKVGNS